MSSKMPHNLKVAAWLLIFILLAGTHVYADDIPSSFQLGRRLLESPVYQPPTLKGLVIDNKNPCHFKFLIDTGDSELYGEDLKEESEKLIRYFLTAVTVAQDDIWVNLSPYEQNRIVPEEFGRTEMAQGLLSQDFLLKQLAASLTYPETEQGKKYWDEVIQNSKVKRQNKGVSLLQGVNDFNKVWIVPGRTMVHECGNCALIAKKELKVMLDSDYMALRENRCAVDKVSSQAMREFIIPRIEREISNGRNFALLRQIHSAVILALWYKQRLKQSILNKIYADKNKMEGVGAKDQAAAEKIYARYVEAFKVGAYDYIRKEGGPPGCRAKRRYFSGGYTVRDAHTATQSVGVDILRKDLAGSVQEVDTLIRTLEGRSPQTPESTPAKSHTARPQTVAEAEILRSIAHLRSRGEMLSARVHGKDLAEFGNNATAMVSFIRRHTVVQDVNDLRRILSWKLNALPDQRTGSKASRPLSGIGRQEADLLYEAVFDQDALSRRLAQEKKPLKVVIMRRGRYGAQLTSLFKAMPGAEVTVLLNGTDDGYSLSSASRILEATGVSGAGKILADLSNYQVAVDFLDSRLPVVQDAAKQLDDLINCFFHPADSTGLAPAMAQAYTRGMDLDISDRNQLVKYFRRFLARYRVEAERGQNIRLQNMPLRTIALLGAKYCLEDEAKADGKPHDDYYDDLWPSAIGQLKEILRLGRGNQVALITEARQHRVTLRADGTLHFSEISSSEYELKTDGAAVVGSWLFRGPLHNRLSGKLVQSQIALRSALGDHDLEDFSLDGRSAIGRIDPKDVKAFGVIMNELSTSAGPKRIEISSQAKEALDGADVILYSGRAIEANLAGTLIVPGVKEAIAGNTHAVKVMVDEVGMQGDSSLEDVAASLRKITGYLEKKSPYAADDPGWKKSRGLVDYVLVGDKLNMGSEKRYEVEKVTDHGVSEVIVGAADSGESGFYSSSALREAVVTLAGFNKAGFRVVDNRLVPKNYTGSPKEAQLGLFARGARLALDLRGKLKNIIASGGAFVFDVDNTILPQPDKDDADTLIFYTKLANSFMRLLRKGLRVRIISGNSQAEQMRRIYYAIESQFRDDPRSLINLAFYVDGGGTKITFRANGNKIEAVGHKKDYDRQFVMSQVTRGNIVDAIDSVFKALRDSPENFGLDQGERREAFRQKMKAANLPVSAAIRYDVVTLFDQGWQLNCVRHGKITGVDIVPGKAAQIAVPCLDLRGGDMSDPNDQVVTAITVKPTPVFQIESGLGVKTSVDIRPRLQWEVVRALGGQGGYGAGTAWLAEKKIRLSSGGTGSTDITMADKADALLDVVSERPDCDPSLVYYFGEEFYFIPGKEREYPQRGNDEEIITRQQEPHYAALSRVNKLAVNNEHTEGLSERTDLTWIGRTPQATLEFLELLLDDGDSGQTFIGEYGGVKFTSQSFDLDIQGKMDFDINAGSMAGGDIVGVEPVVLGINPVQLPK